MLKNTINYSKFLSKRSKRRLPSAIRELIPIAKEPGMISFGAGNPNPNLFPFKKIKVELENDVDIEVEGNILNQGLQYSSSYGLPSLIETLKEKQKKVHTTQREDDLWTICITNGSQSALNKTFDMLLDEEDTLLVENPTYSGALAALNPINCNIVGVDTDQHGLDPSHLEEILENRNQTNEKAPKALYIIPTGQNPSGSTLSTQRKRSIYQLAQQYDFLILEDDPYFYMRFNHNENQNNNHNSNNIDYNDYQSFLSLDTDGRVIRFDSFSKIISSGIRFGFATGPNFFMEKLQLDMQSSELHATGLTQAIVYSLLKEWKEEGFNNQIRNVQNFYKEKRDTFCSLADKYLSGLATWNIPTAGMFVWIKCNNVEDTQALINTKAVEEKVLMVPGASFFGGERSSDPCPYVRASFSIPEPADMEEGLKRFANLLKNYSF